jgi:hypothetical protein
MPRNSCVLLLCTGRAMICYLYLLQHLISVLAIPLVPARLVTIRRQSGTYPAFMGPWCNLAASQRRPYCASVNSHSPVGLVSRQWEAVDWACVLCDRRIHNDRASRSANLHQCSCPFYKLSCRPFWQNVASPRFVSRFDSLRLLDFPITKIALGSEERVIFLYLMTSILKSNLFPAL